jgi:CheY-like chemotaxis protein
LERKVISLVPVVQEAGRLLRSTLPAGVALNVQCDPDAPAVLADASQIEQVLLNLCSNAWHAVRGQKQAGTIEVRLNPEVRNGLRFASLTVRDNGKGMDEATRSRIFEPFFTTKQVGEGTGLGLSVVHGILKEHEASIEVSSALGHGTTFAILFPAAQASEQVVSTHKPNVAPTYGQGKHVLYVDDDESIVFLMTRLLERQGYRVSGYTDPREALAAVRAKPNEFDMAVTDYNMPGMSGLDVARALKEIRGDLPVAMASGYITDELRTLAPAAGVSELIYKPNTIEELCEAVARLATAKRVNKTAS